MWWPFQKKSAPVPEQRSCESEAAIADTVAAHYQQSTRARVLRKSDSSITFAVDDVACIDTALPTTTPREQWLLRGISALEAHDSAPVPLRKAEPLHGLLAALHLAYSEHRPFALAPHDVWLCILHALARQIGAHPEKFRAVFVSHEGSQTITVRRDEFVVGSDTNDWATVVDELSRQVLSHASDHAKSLADLSVLGDQAGVVTTATQIALLGAMQNYFELRVHTLCGIPSITVEGSAEQWHALRQRILILRELELESWYASVDFVLQQICATCAGDVSQRFWREIYKREQASGGEKVSGWINVLFPFLGDHGTAYDNPLAVFGDHWPEHALEASSLRSFAPGLASAPFEWKILSQTRPMSLIGGFLGAAQDNDGTVRSRVGWAVAPRMRWKRFRIEPHGVALSGVPALSPRPGELPVDLQGITDEASELPRWTVELSFASSLRSLHGLELARGLQSVQCLMVGIESIEPLRKHPTLCKLSLAQCDFLSDLSAIVTLPALRSLSLNHLGRVTDWRFLLDARLDQLEEFSWFGATVPDGLSGMHRGRDAVGAVRQKLRAKYAAP
jgi:hypothetical protein